MLSEISQSEKDNYHTVPLISDYISSSAEDNRGREGKLNGKKSERETNHETPDPEKLRVAEREVGGGWG